MSHLLFKARSDAFLTHILIILAVLLLAPFADLLAYDETLGTKTDGDSRKTACSDRVVVYDRTELVRAIVTACAGRHVVMAEGVYRNVIIDIGASGTKNKPVIVEAMTPGRTYIEGRSTIKLNGDYVQLKGLVFRNGEPALDRGAVVMEGSYGLLTETVIDGFDNPENPIYGNEEFSTTWVTLLGSYNEISYNHFKNKRVRGALLAVNRKSNDAQHHFIHHNHFEKFSSGNRQNGWETIRLGSSHFSRSDSHTRIESNRFDQCDGEVEIISVKSGRNVLRNNTFVDSSGFLTLRHGLNNLVESNIFLQYGKVDGGGVRVLDGGHIIKNNYIAGVVENQGGIVLHSGVNPVGKAAKSLNTHWTPYDINIVDNSIVDSEHSIYFGGNRKYAGNNFVFRNNFILGKKESEPMRIDLMPTNIRFENELYYSDRYELYRWYKGSVKDIKPFKGIRLAKAKFTYPKVKKTKNGLYLHEKFGAKNLTYLSTNDVGPRTH